MAVVCKTSNTIDFSPGVINFKGLKVGHSFPDEWAFTDDLGAAIDISSFDFDMIIADSTGAVVDTLTLGTVLTTGLEYVATNKLKMLIGAPTTNLAGVYTYQLIITEPGGGNYPWFIGSIPVAA